MKDLLNVIKENGGCREFDPNETILWLKSDLTKFRCWAPHNFINLKNKGLLFNVNGMKHKGYVLIVLNGLDLYNIILLNKSKGFESVHKDVYCDQLNEFIDNLIENVYGD